MRASLGPVTPTRDWGGSGRGWEQGRGIMARETAGAARVPQVPMVLREQPVGVSGLGDGCYIDDSGIVQCETEPGGGLNTDYSAEGQAAWNATNQGAGAGTSLTADELAALSGDIPPQVAPNIPTTYTGPRTVRGNVAPPPPPPGTQWANVINSSGQLILKTLIATTPGAYMQTLPNGMQIVAGAGAGAGLSTLNSPFGSATISTPMIMLGLGLVALVLIGRGR